MEQSLWQKISKLTEFGLRYNTILSVIIMSLNTFVLLRYHDSQYSIIPCLLLLSSYLYFFKTSMSHKCRMLFTYVTFSLLTIIGEDFVIRFSKGTALKYGTPSLQTKVPLWLFGAYLNMVVLIWLLDDFGIFVENNILTKTHLSNF